MFEGEIAENPAKKINLECVQKDLWEELGVSVREYKRPMFTVRRENDTTRWATGDDHPLLSEYNLKVKYSSAIELVLDHCEDVPKALKAVQRHSTKFRRSTLNLRQSHAAKP